ncbi:methyltransferase [Oryctes borbonicus]|uniref:Methyltransferase n=1 Tax=Oryctes borbonicus TaxID=1629725 RepID=A0A0T6BDA2_9SCAR|nr:methyltransferase [Oryctes borbonicus]
MKNLNGKDRPSMQFMQMDVLNMTFEDKKFSVVLDKGTLDALMPDDKDETLKKIERYFEEVSKVLKHGGKYICISLLQEHIAKKLLTYFSSNNWAIKIIRCHEAENKGLEENETALPVFIIVCTKNKITSPMVLEISLSPNKFVKYETVNDVLNVISGIQRAAIVCSHLKNTSVTNQEQISFDLFENENSKPRFTVYIVDILPERGHSPYAGFIVPQGRESEWLFSTNEGRMQLAKLSKNNRLVIITLHRDQKYGTLDDVKEELNDVVRKFAPSNVTHKIAFLSLGSDVGNRTVRHKGKSKHSGDYVVEDVEIENGVKYRRLYYLQSQLIIQSEAQLKTVKSRRGHPKDVVDPLYLTCKHHLHMNIATHLTYTQEDSFSIFVVGLGGGGLCTFMRKFLPKATIKVVDIDEDMFKIATDWFGFKQDEKLTVDILDGVESIENSVKEETKWNAVLFDVDSKDTTIGMSCPPKQFLEDTVLRNVVSMLSNSGVFILNMVLRDTKLRSSIITKLKGRFKLIASFKLEEDLNEVVICFKKKIAKEDLITMFKNSCKEMNKFMKSNGLPKEEHITVSDYISNLNIENI